MKWRENDLEYLREKYPTNISLKEISSKLNRSIKAIKHKAAREELSRLKTPINKPKDKKHRKKYDKRYYLKNKKKIYKKKRDRIRNYKIELLSGLGGKCVNCGYKKCPASLDFHHKGDKESEVMVLLKNYSKEKALKEAKKCIVLCANCHRELHYKGA